MAKILVIEDDGHIAVSVQEYLTSELHDVQITEDGAEGMSRLRHYRYDLVILDWGLPNLDGMSILKELRGQSNRTPVLMLTGKSAIQDREKGLDTGADDYLVKPFHVRELGARVKALLRRPVPSNVGLLELGTIKMDTSARLVTNAGVPLKLSPYEYDLLHYMLNNNTRIIAADELLHAVWGADSTTTIDTLRTHLNRLRTKLSGGQKAEIIQNIYGVGYKLNLD